MNITIFGANGAIGTQLVEQALQAGHSITAFVRKPNALSIKHDHLTILVGSYDDLLLLEEAIKPSEVVISTLGPALSMSRKVESLPIAEAHKSIIQTMEKLGKKRFVTLATPSIQAKEDRKQLVTVMPSKMAKILYPTGFTEMKTIGKMIQASTLDWTVVRIINPNVKSNGNSYAITFGEEKGKMGVSRYNVAKCMLDAVNKDEWIHKMPIVYNK